MIQPQIFDMQKLLNVLLGIEPHTSNWRPQAEIIPKYVAGPTDSTPRCVVRFGHSFLRHSKGPRQGHFWDVYGDDYLTPELALIALMEAEPPSWFLGELLESQTTDAA